MGIGGLKIIEKDKLEMVREFLIGIKKEGSEVFHEIRVLVDEIDEKPLNELIYKSEKTKPGIIELEEIKEKLRLSTNLIYDKSDLKKNIYSMIDEIKNLLDVFLVGLLIKGALGEQSESCETEKNREIEESLNNIFSTIAF